MLNFRDNFGFVDELKSVRVEHLNLGKRNQSKRRQRWPMVRKTNKMTMIKKKRLSKVGRLVQEEVDLEKYSVFPKPQMLKIHEILNLISSPLLCIFA